MNLSGLFQAHLENLNQRLKLIRYALNHGGTKGFLVEKSVINFLDLILSGNLAVTSGFITDSNNQMSKQLDIIIYDKIKAAHFFNSENITVMPCEFVYCVIEVKSRLKPNEMDNVYENMESVKKLKRNSIENEGKITKNDFLFYGKVYTEELPPPIYIVFAIELESASKIKQKLEELDNKSDIDKRIDFIFSLDKSIANLEDDGCTLIPTSKTKRIIYPETKENGGTIDASDIEKAENNLALWFYAILTKYSNKFSFGNYNFNFFPYYKNIIK